MQFMVEEALHKNKLHNSSPLSLSETKAIRFELKPKQPNPARQKFTKMVQSSRLQELELFVPAYILETLPPTSTPDKVGTGTEQNGADLRSNCGLEQAHPCTSEGLTETDLLQKCLPIGV